MFEKLLHSHKIRKLQSAQRSMDKRYSRIIERAKKAKESRESIDEIGGEWSEESRWGDDEILQLNSNFLRAEAERLFVPYPDWSTQRQQYEESDITGKVRLTQAAQANLRKAIREERKEAAQQLLIWVPGLSLLVALAGVAVAALAIVIRH